MADSKEPIFHLEIVTPERKFFSDSVQMVILETLEGQVGILKDHAPMIMAVAVGTVRIKKEDKWVEAVLTEGFMDINKEGATILVDAAEWPNEIDIRRAEEAKKKAEEKMQRQLSEIEYQKYKAQFMRAMTRLKVGSRRGC